MTKNTEKHDAVHPTALVESKEIGEGTTVWAYTHIMEGASIGKDCNIGDHCFIESGVVLGDGVVVKNGNMLFEGLTLQEGVFVAPHVFFTNDLYPRSRWLPQTRWRDENKTWLVPTLVKRGASLGAGAILLGGIVIGEYATIGAGAVVVKDVVPHALVIGNPARKAKWVCQCGQPLRFNDEFSVCDMCGLAYRQHGSSIELWHDHGERRS